MYLVRNITIFAMFSSLLFLEGYCFQFNSDGSFVAYGPGKTGGVQFELDAMVDQYSAGPYSNAEGFSVCDHNIVYF